MGCTSEFKQYDGKLSEQALQDAYAIYQKECDYESGHMYSGRLNMCSGLKIVHKKFRSYKVAEKYILDNTHKWEEAMAVRVHNVWVVGGWCAE